jgi:hypothetical protein
MALEYCPYLFLRGETAAAHVFAAALERSALVFA